MGKLFLIHIVLIFLALKANAIKDIPPKSVSLKGAVFCQDPDVLLKLPDVQFLNASEKIDRIVILKSIKKIYFLSQGRVFRVFDTAMGSGSLDGHKVRRGDGRTPEGLYFIDYKKSDSSYNLALHLSYPNEADRLYAKKFNLDPGSDIMIHGFPQLPIDGLEPNLVRAIHPWKDWTQGCVAVSDREIEEIYSFVSVGTAVELCPNSSVFSINRAL